MEYDTLKLNKVLGLQQFVVLLLSCHDNYLEIIIDKEMDYHRRHEFKKELDIGPGIQYSLPV